MNVETLPPDVNVTLLVPLINNGVATDVEKLPVPVTFTPVPEIVIVVLPTAAIVTLPFAVPKNTLLLPFANVPMMLPKKRALPPTINEYGLVIVALVPAVGPAGI